MKVSSVEISLGVAKRTASGSMTIEKSLSLVAVRAIAKLQPVVIYR
ncbi:hypothetical protein [Komarekiella delphini-convector]|nr:hypothetical protein [Komarekiella delphini-convector]